MKEASGAENGITNGSLIFTRRYNNSGLRLVALRYHLKPGSPKRMVCTE